MASNIHLLASKQFFLITTSQGLVGAGMNCRASQDVSNCKRISGLTILGKNRVT